MQQSFNVTVISPLTVPLSEQDIMTYINLHVWIFIALSNAHYRYLPESAPRGDGQLQLEHSMLCQFFDRMSQTLHYVGYSTQNSDDMTGHYLTANGTPNERPESIFA